MGWAGMGWVDMQMEQIGGMGRGTLDTPRARNSCRDVLRGEREKTGMEDALWMGRCHGSGKEQRPCHGDGTAELVS